MKIPTQGHETKAVDIRQLKQFAFSRLRKKHILQKLILTDKDQLSVEEFIIKTEIWLKILDFE